ncbi:recombination mediator RecR [Alphaproteobacteria bacterium]|jgi:recombination protein RecR|nr:recombination mediator RecR [Alphaproteobacteria bacterium]
MNPIDLLIQLLARLPGLGPRSARRVALFLIKKRESLLLPLSKALENVAENIQECSVCSNLDTLSPCAVCRDEKRDPTILCVLEEVADLWALERTASFKGRYHVLGGHLSALDGIGPEDLNISSLVERVERDSISEIILATNLTVDGETTAHYVAERLEPTGVKVTRLAHGVPVGGELDYLDDGTLTAALRARRVVGTQSS